MRGGLSPAFGGFAECKREALPPSLLEVFFVIFSVVVVVALRVARVSRGGARQRRARLVPGDGPMAGRRVVTWGGPPNNSLEPTANKQVFHPQGLDGWLVVCAAA